MKGGAGSCNSEGKNIKSNLNGQSPAPTHVDIVEDMYAVDHMYKIKSEGGFYGGKPGKGISIKGGQNG